MADLDPQQQQPMVPGPSGMAQNLQPGGMPSPLPAASPVQPQAQQAPMPSGGQQAGPQDFSSLVQSVMGLPQFAGPMGQLSEIQQKEETIRQRQAELSRPESQPKWGPQVEKGKSFLHNLGQVLLMAASATKPGGAIVSEAYAPNIKKYGEEKAGLASQLETLKQQEAVPTEQLRATTGGAQAVGMGQYRSAMAGAAQSRAASYAQAVQGRLQRELAQTAQAWQGLDIKAKQQAAQQWYQQQEARLREEAIAAGLTENEARVSASQAIANVVAASGMTKEFSLTALGQAWGLLGPSAMPAAPQTPGGASPTAQPQPMQPTRPQAKGAAPAAKAQTGGYKVGQQVTIKGKSMTITAVHPDGSFDAK